MRIFPLLGWMFFPGCWAGLVTGPGTVRGHPGGSVTVRCRYERGYEEHPKYWCRAGSVLWSCPDDHLAVTDKTKAEVKRGRVSIWDNQTQRVFTVTVESLTRADAGTYRCGIGTGPLRSDHTHTVTVLVSPDASSPSATGRSQSTPDKIESPSTSQPTSTWTTAEEGQSSSPTSQHTTSSEHFALYILIPCVLLVLILCLLATIVLVRVTKKRKKGTSVQRDKKINLSNLGVENNVADGHPEYDLLDSPMATAQTELYANAEILPNTGNPGVSYKEIQSHRQGTAETQEVSYATLVISTSGQQPIYANTEQHPKAVHPASPPNQGLYSSVKKPKH